ncbi:MAG: carboxylesterase [Chloroflexi bacterium]|nr:MAG: carboxylesterase [Chloroflexota bacterium]MBA4376454.1 carboxylesterase [Anaerolinea sp.]
MNSTQTMPTAEPFFIPGSKIGCLLVHGFTGTPKEMRMLADSLAQEKFTILAVRLSGHATSPEDMNRTRWNDWIASVEDGLNLLKGCTDQQVVMGLSMGGILSLIAAARFDVKGVISFSTPAALPEDPRLKFLPFFAWLFPRAAKGKPDWQNPAASKDHAEYSYYPTRSILQLKKLLTVMHNDLSRVTVPAFFVQSRGDHSIPPDSMDTLFENISSIEKTKLWVENSGHVVIREPDREIIFAAVKQFIERITSKR